MDKSTSKMEFGYRFGNNPVTGNFGQYAIDLRLDFNNTGNSSVDVVLQTATARGGLFFATRALLGASVLDAAQFPTIHFASTKFRVDGDLIKIDGHITIRDVTRPITIDAQIFRPKGADGAKRDTFTIELTAMVNRHDFDAGGYSNLVGRDLKILINAHINWVR